MDFDDLQIQPKLNRHVRRLMHEWGSDLSKSHNIDHNFYATKRENAQAMLLWAKDRGFEISEIHQTSRDGNPLYSFTMTVASAPNPAELDAQTNQMLRLAMEHECEYDGWGTLIEE